MTGKQKYQKLLLDLNTTMAEHGSKIRAYMCETYVSGHPSVFCVKFYLDTSDPYLDQDYYKPDDEGVSGDLELSEEFYSMIDLACADIGKKAQWNSERKVLWFR